MQLIEKSDVFGRMTHKTDLGGHVTDFRYDAAGRVVRRHGAGAIALNYDYYNTGLVQSIYTDLINPTLKDEEGALYLELYADVRQAAFENMQWGEDQNDDGDKDVFDYANRHYAVHGIGGGRANPATLQTQRRTTYAYDKAGNVIGEKLVDEGLPGDPVYVNESASYDALGRLTHWQEAGSGGGAVTPPASIDYKYDASGNIRNSKATFRDLDAQGNASATDTVQDYWYRFDALNRVVTQQGKLENGQIVRDFRTVDIGYDRAGQRLYALRYRDASVSLPTGGEQPGPYPGSTVPIFETFSFTEISREDFVYDDAGRLDQVRTGKTIWNVNGTPTDKTDDFIDDPTAATTTLSADFTYDAMGRLTHQINYAAGGFGIINFERRTAYNEKGQILTAETWTPEWDPSGKWFHALATYQYGVSGAATYALGAALSIETQNWEINNGVETGMPTSRTTNIYEWWDGPVQSQLKHKPDIGESGENVSIYTYQNIGGAAQLSSVRVNDGRPRTIVFRNDLSGQAIRRDEGDFNTPPEEAPDYNGDPHEVWHRFNGKEIGHAARNGIGSDFDQSIAHFNRDFQGSGAATYSVRSGDTLSSIAAQLWGDSSLWYKLAEANGLSGASTLIEGQVLTIPAGVTKNTHNASTFTPYNQNEVIGETLPTTPKAPKKNKCGTFGMILLVVIAVVVSVYTAGAASGFFASMFGGNAALATGIVAGTATAASVATAGAGTIAGVIVGSAVGGAVGSAVSQFVGVKLGIQEKFSWNAVAMAGIGAAVGAGLGASKTVASVLGRASFGGQAVQAGLRGALGNAVTQGIGAATGWQREDFSWIGVAAAGVGAGFRFQAAEHWVGDSAPTWARVLASGAAAAIANAATRSALEDSDFDENLRRSIPDVIGQTIGEAIAGGLAQSGEKGMKSIKNFEKGASKDTGALAELEIDFAGNDPPLVMGGLEAWEAVLGGPIVEAQLGESGERWEIYMNSQRERASAQNPASDAHVIAGNPMGIEEVLGAEASALAAQSPTLIQGLQQADRAGWAVVLYGSANSASGSYSDPVGVIYLDRFQLSNPAALIQDLSHELGHALNPEIGDRSSENAYVQSQLRGEGRATILNIRVQREISVNAGVDIGVATTVPDNDRKYGAIYDSYLRTGDEVAAANEIGRIYGSTERAGSQQKLYRDWYRDYYWITGGPRGRW